MGAARRLSMNRKLKICLYSHSIAPSIDGVCRRFTSILHELERQGHETMLFTMESEPQDLPSSTRTITLDHMFFASYPNKKVARPTISAVYTIFKAILTFQPEVWPIIL